MPFEGVSTNGRKASQESTEHATFPKIAKNATQGFEVDVQRKDNPQSILLS